MNTTTPGPFQGGDTACWTPSLMPGAPAEWLYPSSLRIGWLTRAARRRKWRTR